MSSNSDIQVQFFEMEILCNMGEETGPSHSQLSTNSLEVSPICSTTLSAADVGKPRPKLHVTTNQRELMLKFISDNPEIITHSSTKENERELWKELVTKLNDLRPEKSVDNWKNFWQRWQASVGSKPESILTKLDCKLKVFLAKIMNNSKTIERDNSRARYTIKEIEDTIRDIEKERSKQQLQIDENDYKIEIYKINIKRLENENTEKRKRIQQINDKKKYLHKRRRIITRLENVDESSEYTKIKQEIKEESLV